MSMRQTLAIICLAALWATTVPADATGLRHRSTPAPEAVQGDSAQVGFKVSGFRVLPNDVSAFITPVRDLNGDACALVKVVAPPEFAFSSPLGIVKRQNEVGEIWLYLPRRTKLLTIKHPQWGVLRDYRFAQPLESRMVYELKIEVPRPEPTLRRDTVFFTQTVTDTVVVSKARPRLPLNAHTLLTAAFHDRGPSWGVMFSLLKRHGFFVHGQSDFRRIGTTVATCDEEGFLPGSDIKPYYTGATRRASYAVTAGVAHRLWPWLNLFYGVGYGRSSVAWQLADSEGGGYALNEGRSHKGMAAEAGLMLSIRRVSLSVSALTVAGRQWQAGIGIGVKLWKKE